jgi:hypothetical protein
MNKAEAEAMNGPHGYVLFDPLTGSVMRAERAQHFVVPVDILDQGDVAIAHWCKANSK